MKKRVTLIRTSSLCFCLSMLLLSHAKGENVEAGVGKVSGKMKLETEILDDSLSISIGLSDTGKAREAYEKERLDLDVYRRSSKGDNVAQQKWAGLSAERQVPTLAKALGSGQESMRLKAVKTLIETMESKLDEKVRGKGRQALIRAAIHDGTKEIRERARDAWLGIARGDGADAREAIREMGEGMDVNNPLEKRRVFEALKNAGGPAVVEVLVTKITQRWGKGPRNHIMIAQQRSYIADYDVSGATFDPVIRSFLVGVVLDSQMMGVELIQYVVEELQRMGANEAVRKDPGLWNKFLKAKKREAQAGK